MRSNFYKLCLMFPMQFKACIKMQLKLIKTGGNCMSEWPTGHPGRSGVVSAMCRRPCGVFGLVAP